MNVKSIGATLLISGTMLGAGMLALPLISAGLGIYNTILLLTVLWVVMTYTGLMLLEICLNYPEGTGLEAIAYDLFGKPGKWVINISLLLLLYALSCAYIAGASSIYKSDFTDYFHISLSSHTIAIIFTLIIATIVFISTKAVDIANRVLFTSNIVIFFILVITIIPYLHGHFLVNNHDSAKYAFAAIPVFITAFGFHGSVPSMVKYIGRDKPKTLRNIFIAGGLIPLIVYIIWEISMLGSLPRFGNHSFQYVAQHGSSVGVMLQQMQIYIQNNNIIYLIGAFSSIAMFTSYLCVSLGLFDSLASTFKRGNNTVDRLMTAVLCYLPPLVFTLVYPDGFVPALGAAAIFLTILAILFPVLALRKLRGKQHQIEYNVATNNMALFVVGFIGLQVIINQILTLNNAVPIFN
ncbi:amino acid permease [Photobacterium phosphoreum]|jgi:tyrosine-specific transport protein|uniref:Aromatic amino acid permease n=1 Tax=Photobacterium phosphoreum TaxID=659 RepID=A0AAW4ZZ41_PHOPO|nr:aromatic amino acid transporter [Photobacterium phosphoreum]KJF87721.1 tyrosine transporter [Photobacterium phosphoreum]MCD9462317.1 tyrosine transporter [Photobacterium phosphoreum]MCD9472750.1 tyrosine transporter [Photobacterium phosphoreum]MCD9476455.1 amino acid permease [Photobacterium phosphoreum]MCD9478401.1 amino acid permease [Photobacterium phosphoreum]